MRKKENILYDFGRVTMPESWEEVSLKQFVELMRASDRNKGTNIDVRDVIAILTGKDKEWVNLLPAQFVNSLMIKLVFMHKAPDKTPTNEIRIKGETYRINFVEELKFGEYVDINTLIQQDSLNYPAFLAILCRKEGEVYDDEFTSHIEERVKLFESIPVTDVLPVIAFFLHLWGQYETLSRHSLQEMADTAAQFLEDIELSRKSGEYKELPIRSRMRISLWLKRFRGCLQRVSSSI